MDLKDPLAGLVAAPQIGAGEPARRHATGRTQTPPPVRPLLRHRAARQSDGLRADALQRLAANRAGRPQRPRHVAQPRRTTPSAVLRRHGVTTLSPRRLELRAVRALIDGQARADRDAGLDWTRITAPAAALDDALRARARAAADRPRRPARLGRAATTAAARSARRLGLDPARRRRSSRAGRSPTPTRSTPTTCAAGGSASPTLAGARRRPARPGRRASSARSACFLAPAPGGGWELAPDASRWTRSGCSPRSAPRSSRDLRARHAARRRDPASCSSAATRARCTPARASTLDSAGQLAEALTRELGARRQPGRAATTRCDRWGRAARPPPQPHRPRRRRARRARAARRHASRAGASRAAGSARRRSTSTTPPTAR